MCTECCFNKKIKTTQAKQADYPNQQNYQSRDMKSRCNSNKKVVTMQVRQAWCLQGFKKEVTTLVQSGISHLVLTTRHNIY